MVVRAAVSGDDRDTALETCGGRYEVVFNGVELDRFATATPQHDEQGRPAVVFIGRHEPRKGLGVLLRAFAEVRQPAVLWVIGDGPDTEAARRAHPESDRVHWLGRLGHAEAAARLA